MLINQIIDYVNRGFIASDYVRAPQIYYYMDLVIDDINDRLNAKFPTMSEWPDFVDKWNEYLVEHNIKDVPIKEPTVYDAFPNRYIRSVLALGTAVKFYTRDEEGEQIALDYQNRYEMELFKMTRDYINLVPEYFQNNEGGFIPFTYVHETDPEDLVPRGMVLRGDDTRIL